MNEIIFFGNGSNRIRSRPNKPYVRPEMNVTCVSQANQGRKTSFLFLHPDTQLHHSCQPVLQGELRLCAWVWDNTVWAQTVPSTPGPGPRRPFVTPAVLYAPSFGRRLSAQDLDVTHPAGGAEVPRHGHAHVEGNMGPWRTVQNATSKSRTKDQTLHEKKINFD